MAKDQKEGFKLVGPGHFPPSESPESLDRLWEEDCRREPHSDYHNLQRAIEGLVAKFERCRAEFAELVGWEAALRRKAGKKARKKADHMKYVLEDAAPPAPNMEYVKQLLRNVFSNMEEVEKLQLEAATMRTGSGGVEVRELTTKFEQTGLQED